MGPLLRIGSGNSINDIHLSNQRTGLRSFVDIRAKGSIWITGGWEYDYYQGLLKFADVANLDLWQKSALAGLTKKYKIGKQDANMQVLYDFLASQQTPHAPAIKFRIGYDF